MTFFQWAYLIVWLIVMLFCAVVIFFKRDVVAAGEHGGSQSRPRLRQARGRAGKPILPSARPAPPVTLRFPPYAKL